MRLQLREKPDVRHVQHQARSLGLVDAGLLAKLRGLVGGELRWPLFLHGGAGGGKTCAGLALLDHAGGEYYTVPTLCDTMIRAQQGRLEWYREGHGGTLYPEDVWAKIEAATLAVLDELGTRQNVSDHAYEVTKQFIDLRQGKPLIAISNLDLDQIEKLFDSRIASRLAAGVIVHLRAPDRRLEARGK